MKKRLPFAKRETWRFRWLCGPKTWGKLHRIASGKKADNGFVGVRDGRTVCGLKGDFWMPGVFSRMGRDRCIAVGSSGLHVGRGRRPTPI